MNTKRQDCMLLKHMNTHSCMECKILTKVCYASLQWSMRTF